ncbi:hypothetical protein CANCADRAFT_57992 [Tortispora caseinolytica NRRL Y-17796]|uniref:J domain-containing protein n=1 Tax=Tortispora caseinolytica NRRL Y-17796 TaxID=767744 RepID=A0A1E4TAY8_9ASCO|nr:hypothetical protein CANCADRAFT_57992 [Tortispora caseinolytica NRRL Y-17796]
MSTSRDHNQGNQSRSYTSAQKAAVERVRKCQHHEYYAILDVETSATDNDIKKAYRKLALIMHPDKNSAPGADEAFKMVSKAFQVLSDPQKKRIFDQTGQDPDSRGMGSASGTSARAGGPAGAGFGDFFNAGGAGEMSPEDLFNMFFGGPPGAAGGGPFQSFGFGGPGIRIHSFGGSPYASFGGPRRRPAQNRAGNQANENILSTLIQFLPLILLIVLPLLSGIWESFTSGPQTPAYRYDYMKPYTSEFETPNHHIKYYMKPKDVNNLSDRQKLDYGRKVEHNYIQNLKWQCETQYSRQQQDINEAQGWFFTDKDRLDEAMNRELPACNRLEELGMKLRY